MAIDGTSIKNDIDNDLGNKGYRGIRIATILTTLKKVVDWVTVSVSASASSASASASSATQAASSATSANSSASTASTSATNAASSATAASASATSAGASASTATSKAGEAVAARNEAVSVAGNILTYISETSNSVTMGVGGSIQLVNSSSVNYPSITLTFL